MPIRPIWSTTAQCFKARQGTCRAGRRSLADAGFGRFVRGPEDGALAATKRILILDVPAVAQAVWKRVELGR
jgi:hypothetical protein